MTDDQTTPRGWPLLHSKLPPKALKPLSKDIYGVEGLTDVNEGYLIQRLYASGLPWEWEILEAWPLGREERTTRSGTNYAVYLTACRGRLTLEGRHFDGLGASENRRLDAAWKGAATVAFKNATKLAGMWIELLLDGRAIDHIYEGSRTGEIAPAAAAPETRAALEAAQATPAAETQAPATTTPPPASTGRRGGRSASPRATRLAVVPAPEAPAPVEPEVIAAEALPVAEEPPIPEPGESSMESAFGIEPEAAQALDPLADQRHHARLLAARLAYLTTMRRNQAAARNGQPPEALPPLEPNSAADARLESYLDQQLRGATLNTISESTLESVRNALQGMISQLEAAG